MKKLSALIVMAIVSLSISAQTYIGGSFGLGYDIDDEAMDFTLSPEVGYNLNNQWAVGGTLGYSYDGSIEANSFVFEPYARFTFAKVADDKLHFFCDGAVGIGILSAKRVDTGTIWQIGFKPGMSYCLNNHWSLVAHLGFLGYSGADDNAQDLGCHNSIGFNFGSLNLSFGAYYSF